MTIVNQLKRLQLFLVVCLIALSSCGRTSTYGEQEEVAAETNCTNKIDDDVDGLSDCFDPDCNNEPTCWSNNEHCSNKIDDDGDGAIDCDDTDCVNHPSCLQKEICDNQVDDDKDGLVDCFDSDCFTDPSCLQEEICDNNVDDDKDGLIDCDDSDCKNEAHCRTVDPEICYNFIDDDNDGLVDCDDPDCFNDLYCQTIVENCINKIDDDNDGLVDCDDPDCYFDPSCITTSEICDNKIDDDGNGLIDCDDPGCRTDPSCDIPPENCVNLVDDDKDGKTDCDDSDCNTHPACQVSAENCTNHIDDDGDGRTDCNDPDCYKHPDCKQIGQEVCNNNVDDDEDGFVDCDDSDCSHLAICTQGNEICDNKIDDDHDGATDCDDPDCSDFSGCQSELCQPSVDFGTINPTGSSVTRTITTTSTTHVYESNCAIGKGGEVVAQFVLSADADIKLSYLQQSGDHVVSLYRAGISEACNANPIDCYDPNSAKEGEFSIKSLSAGHYYLLIEAFSDGLEGQVDITLSTGTVTSPENCINGVDDDGDGAIDCADIDCKLDPNCITKNCIVDYNLGTLVVDGPAKDIVVDTTNSGDDVVERCAAGGGNDIVIRIVMPTSAGLNVTVDQQGWHVLGLHSDKGPGTTCTAHAGSCFVPNQIPAFILEYGVVEKGVYYYIVESKDATSSGVVSLSFSAFSPRGPELCANNIDDDGDGMVDCKDPDCTGVVGCPGPVCSADYKTGLLAVGGNSVLINVDTTTANNDQTVTCALGGGKDEVIEIELKEVSGLRVSCNQSSGDQVLGLFIAAGPRDPCDTNQTNCADPSTGALGCNFIFPNLQPGTYYMVVEAFQAGSEGQMQIELAAVEDYAQEICNNNIDDDGDGKIDCLDSNCSLEPHCQGQTCVPDRKIGLLVKNGSIQSVAVTTTGAGDNVSSVCANGAGEDSVISFTLAEQSTISLEYAQFGNHIFALYEDKGVGYVCDAAPIDCVTSNNNAVGKLEFSNVFPGEYFLVVEAADSGDEGSAIMQLSAK